MYNTQFDSPCSQTVILYSYAYRIGGASVGRRRSGFSAECEVLWHPSRIIKVFFVFRWHSVEHTSAIVVCRAMGFLSDTTWTYHWHAHFLSQQGGVFKNDLLQLGLISRAVPPMLQALVAFHWFQKHNVAFMNPRGPASALAFKSVCSCTAFAIEATSENVIYVQGLEWPGKSAERILSSTPQPKRRGRPQRPVTSCGRKRALSLSV